MKKTPPKKIPWEMLVKAKHETEIRPRKLGEHTVSINQAVMQLKAARQTGVADRGLEQAWFELVEILNFSIGNREFEAFDEFASAWENVEVDSFVTEVAGIPIVVGMPKNRPRQRVTYAIVFAVDILQTVLDRPPTRAEIMDFVATHEAMPENMAIDETEVSRQLTKLGWNEFIPTAADLAS